MPVVIMIRQTDPVRWEKYATCPNRERAESLYKRRIKGKGITAWTLIVSPGAAELLQANPMMEPSDAENRASKAGVAPCPE